MSKYAVLALLFVAGLSAIFHGVYVGGHMFYQSRVTRDQVVRRELYRDITSRYVYPDGRVVSDDGTTSSESQSYAMLMAVYAGDRETFDKVWGWTQLQLQVRGDNLFSWLWTGGGIKDINSATDADQDIALALLLAHKRWNFDAYKADALRIIKDIWSHDTYEMNGRRYIIGGPYGFVHNDGIVINPSYFAPYAYREFAKVDTEHDWEGLIDMGYETLNACTSDVGLAKDWCKITTGGKVSHGYYVFAKGADIHSYDALRVPYRIAVDYIVSADQRALAYLNKMQVFKRDWEEQGKIFTIYDGNGKAMEEHEFLAVYGAQLASFSVTDRKIADEIYLTKIQPRRLESVENFYELAWLWFGLHVYGNGWYVGAIAR